MQAVRQKPVDWYSGYPVPYLLYTNTRDKAFNGPRTKTLVVVASSDKYVFSCCYCFKLILAEIVTVIFSHVVRYCAKDELGEGEFVHLSAPLGHPGGDGQLWKPMAMGDPGYVKLVDTANGTCTRFLFVKGGSSGMYGIASNLHESVIGKGCCDREVTYTFFSL